MAVFAKKWWQNDFADDVIPSNGAVPTWDTARQQWRPVIPGTIIVGLPTTPPFAFTDDGGGTFTETIFNGNNNGVVYLQALDTNALIGVINNVGVGYVEIDAGSTEAYLFVHAVTGQTTGLIQVQDDDDSKILTFIAARGNPTWQEPSFVGPAGDASQGWIAIAPGATITDFTLGFGTGTGYVSLFASASYNDMGIQAQVGQTQPLLVLRDENGIARLKAFPNNPGSEGLLNLYNIRSIVSVALLQSDYLTNKTSTEMDLTAQAVGSSPTTNVSLTHYVSDGPANADKFIQIYGFINNADAGYELTLVGDGNSFLKTGAAVKIGFFGVAPAAQSAAGTTAADAIACLKAFGLMHA